MKTKIPAGFYACLNGANREIPFLLTAAFLLLGFAGRAQEQITVDLEPFTKISIENSAKVKLIPGSTNSISFEGKEEDRQRLREAVSDGELELRGRPLAKIKITFQKLEEIEIKGNGAVSCSESVTADKFSVDISGAGDVTLMLNVKKLEVDISGAGNLKLSGSADLLDMDISGAGNVDAEEFKVKTCNADISGNGKCIVDVTDELTTHISGSGSVSYKNPPAKINKDISGIGRVSDENETGGGGDTTRFRLGDRNILIISGNDSAKKSKPEKVQPHWAGVEIGFNGYLTPDRTTFPGGGAYNFPELNTGKSIGINLNFFDYGVKIYKRYIQFVTGFGLSYNNYRFRNNYKLVNGAGGIEGVQDTIKLDKSKLTVSYLTLPLLLEFNTSKYEKKSFHVSIGGIVGYKAGSHTKLVYHEDGKKVKPKTYDQFHINPWRVDATARIGWRNLNLFATYDMISLFRSGKGPELNPFMVGISLVGW